MASASESLIGRALVDPVSALIVAAAVGWVVAIYFGRTMARLPPLRLALGLIGLCVFGVGGARAHYLLASSSAPDLSARLADSGVHAAGGVIGVLLGLPVVTRVLGLPLPVMADVCAVSAGISVAVYRIGCQLRGCCIGTPSDLPWAVRYDAHSVAFLVHANARLVRPDAHWSAPVHPLPMYFAAVALLITIAGRLLYGHRRYDGQIAALSLALFSLSTLVLEGFRESIPGQARWGPLPQLAWVAIVLSVASFAVLGACELGVRRRER